MTTEQTPEQLVPHIIDVIRMYRAEKDMTLEEAKATAVREFKKRGWLLPEWAERIEGQ